MPQQRRLLECHAPAYSFAQLLPTQPYDAAPPPSQSVIALVLTQTYDCVNIQLTPPQPKPSIDAKSWASSLLRYKSSLGVRSHAGNIDRTGLAPFHHVHLRASGQ